MVKCNIYCRVSSLIQNEYNKDSPTIESQLANCKSYAEKNKFTINKIYIDTSTGRNIKRKQLNTLVKDLENDNSTYLLINDVSRFSKNSKDGILYLDKLKQNKCTIISVSDNTKFDTLGEIAFFKYKLDKAEEISNELSNKVKESFRIRRERGDYIGRAPYGFKTVLNLDRKLILVINEEEHIFIKEIIELKDSGYSLSKIATILNKKSLKRGKKWNNNSISYLYRKNIIRIKNFNKPSHNYNLRKRI
jgi:site-specific DNA recombinase